MADFQVVTHVPADSAHGGGCYLCKLDQRKNRQGELEPMIATHVEVLLEGQVVICRPCVLEQAYLFGALPAEKAEELGAEIDAMTAAFFHQEEELHAAQAANQALLSERHEAVFGAAPDRAPEPELAFPA